LWFHHRLIIVAQVGDRAFLTARALEDANALAMAQERFMEIVDGAGVLWKQGLQEIVSGIGCDFLADQAEANTYSPYVCIYPQTWLGLLTGT
jgi:hypothetical protein